MAMLKTDLVWALDPVAFAKDALGFAPDPWQAGVLRWSGKRLIMNCARQTGKSTTAGVLGLHTALYYPRSLVLLVSPSLRQSGELFRKVSGFMGVLEQRPKLVEDNKLACKLENGSRIVSLPSTEATVRGFSAPDLVIEDEAARVSDELYAAIRPMLAVSAGKLILMSTPFGKRGHYWEAWDQGGDRWTRIKVTAEECPRISDEFLAEEREAMPAFWYDQEYGCEFLEDQLAVFRYDDIMAMLETDEPPLFGGNEA